ncbi:protein jagged-1b-like [Mercenaria mercenaria]|uniref:protein jagged-1b-like n=1 Tax=Mercenaria mercenaria TaxID=6596 RepID=UPI00234F15D9|nr:protein jagged-1b-like [Mercenaria mercenaria]
MFTWHILHSWIFFQNLAFICVYGSGYVEVRLISYKSKNGTNNVGKCCDTKGPTGCDPCDPYIQIYLSQGKSGVNLSNIVTTGVYNNTNSISFGNTTGKLSNPFKLTFANFTNKLDLTLIAWDADKFDSTNKSSDRLEELLFNVGQGEPSPFYTRPKFVTKVIDGNAVVLTFEYRISCSKNFYGNCNKYCKQKAGQYNCSRSGNKVCELGWSGYECDTGPCNNSKCVHNSTCSPDLSGGYKCNCLPAYSGVFCDTRIPVSSAAGLSTWTPLNPSSKIPNILTTMGNSSIRQEAKSSSSSMLGVIVGCSVAAVFLIVTLLALITRFWLKKKQNKTDSTQQNNKTDSTLA